MSMKHMETVSTNSLSDKEDLSSQSLYESNQNNGKPNLFLFLKRIDYFLIIVGSVIMAASAACTPIQTVFYGDVFSILADFLIGKYSTYNAFIADIRLKCGLIIIVGLAKLLLTFSGLFLWMKYGEITQTRARSAIYDNLSSKKLAWFELKLNLLGEVSQVNRCIEEMRAGVSEDIGLLIETISSVIALLVTSLYYSWSLTLVLMCTAPVLGVLSFIFGRLTYRAAQDENNYSAAASERHTWALSHAAIVRAFNGKSSEYTTFARLVDSSAKAYTRLSLAVAGNSGSMKFLVHMMFVQGFGFGIQMIRLKKLEINQVFTCFSSCLMLGSEVTNLTSILTVLNKAYAASSKVVSLLEDVSEQKVPQEFSPTISQGSIAFSNVTFSYPLRPQAVLDLVNFRLIPNQFNYLIGRSGSGKSTVADLLMKFYDDYHGRITIDGLELKLISPQWISENITYVSQTPMLFDASLKENIALLCAQEYGGLDKVPEHKIQEAVLFSLLNDVYLDNLNSSLIQNKLSGGQRQCLSLARARIKDSNILILDEAMSALSNQKRDLIMQNLKRWRAGKTTIMITHQFSHIDDNDHVILIEDGCIRKEGPFSSFSEEKLVLLDNSSKDKATRPERNSSEIKVEELLNDDEYEAVTCSSMGLFRILLKSWVFIPSKGLLVFGLMMTLMQGAANPVFSYFFSRLLSSMVQASGGDLKHGLLVMNLLIVFAITCVIGITLFLSHFVLNYVGERWIVTLRKKALNKMNDQDISFFKLKGKSPVELTTLLMNDTRDLRNLVSEFLSTLLNLVTMTFVGIVWALICGWKLALVGISFVPLVALLTGTYGYFLKKYEHRYKEEVSGVESHTIEVVDAIKSIRTWNVRLHFQGIFNSKMDVVYNLGTKRALWTSLGEAASDFMTAAASGTILYYGMSLVGQHIYTQENLLQVITLLTFTVASAGTLVNQMPQIARGQRAGTLILELLSEQGLPSECQGYYKQLTLPQKLIEFKNTRFAHQTSPSKFVLKGVSLEIIKNQTLAILGGPGSGKSTLAFCLLRLFAVPDRSLYVGGVDINKLEVDLLRKIVSIVPQNPEFFNGTIEDNLLYGESNVYPDREVVENVLREVNLYEWILGLPEGISTVIGCGGSSFASGGQLQRLAIARALLRRPQVLILDECTSSLDPENRHLIYDLITRLKGTLTILLVTHDKEMMKLSDSAVVLKDGSLVEKGTYDTLVEAKGELGRIIGQQN